MSFAEDLRAWRGKRYQKEVNDIFGVKLETYKAWELGKFEPMELAMEQVRWRMSADKLGVSVEFLRERYMAIIQKVSQEILSRK